MPCYNLMAEKTEDVSCSNCFNLKNELNKVTDFLCNILKTMEKYDNSSYNNLSSDLKNWHIEHKKWDEDNRR